MEVGGLGSGGGSAVWGDEVGGVVLFPPIADASREDSSPVEGGSVAALQPPQPPSLSAPAVVAPTATAATPSHDSWGGTLTGAAAASVVSVSTTPANAIAAMSLDVPPGGATSPPAAATAARRTTGLSRPFGRFGAFLGSAPPPPAPPPATNNDAAAGGGGAGAAASGGSKQATSAAAAMLAAAKSVLWSRT